jgi:hypothetical protein
MVVSTINLTYDNVYVNKDGKLPTRSSFDKELLTALCKNQIVSTKAYNMLPGSIRRDVTSTHKVEPTIGITIDEIDGLTDLLIVVRSIDDCKGKKFRFDRFRLITKQGEIELWIRQRN